MQAASPPTDNNKHSWRKFLKRCIRNIPDHDERSLKIREHLMHWLRDKEPMKIASFAALHGEPQLTPLLLDDEKHDWHLPRVDGEAMTFHRVNSVADLEPGSFGISEPSHELPAVPITEFDCILCPGLGFGRDGSRLGRGRGFYDRALEKCREDTIVIGVAFAEQVFDTLPCDPHDHPMDCLLTTDGMQGIKPT